MSTNAVTAPARPSLLDHDEARIDGREKVSGAAKYSADYAREGMLWAAFVASPHAHARIVSIDASAALAMPGVHGVVTGADVGARYFGCTLKDWPVLAYGRVRFVGEYVAAVAADSRELAAAAADAIDVTYEELQPQLDAEAALAPDAPRFLDYDPAFVFQGQPRPARPHENMQGYDLVLKGDPDAAFASAARVFEQTYTTPRFHAGYIEPRATLLWIDGAGALHVICENKNPFSLRDMLAQTLDLPKEQVIVDPSFIGGEFGAKALTIEEFALYYLAKATGRPIKHVRTHADDVRSTNVRHAATVRVRIATDVDGRILALDLRSIFDGGAYGAAKPGPQVLPGRCPKMPYGIAHARVERIASYTNTIPGAFVRAPGDVQHIFAVESLLDVIANELRIDPLELRRRNAATAADSDLEGNPFSEPRALEVLAAAREAIGWDAPVPAGRGRGIALTARHIAGGKTSFNVSLFADGTLLAETGSTEPGVGTFTVIQRVLAAELGIAPEKVRVARGATDAVPWDPGIGGSKGTLLLGRAALDAARKLKAAIAEAGLDQLAWDAACAQLAKDAPLRVNGEGSYVHQHGTPIWLNFGAYAVDLSVDRDTGALTFHDVVFVADCGAIINPIAHRGQIDGGFLMGFGHALTEELHVEDGRIVNIALSDYKLPVQPDMPPFRVIALEPGDGPGPYGARAAGEMNTSGVAPAIGNAIAAACGVRLDRLSLTAERIYAALQDEVSAVG